MRRTLAAFAVAAATLAGSTAVAGAAPADPKPAPEPSIVDVALAANAAIAGQPFDTLIAAVTRPDQSHVLAALGARGQRTVFAPTDAAFGAIGLSPANIGTVPAGVLSDILLYHVTPGRKYAADVLSSSGYRMLNGDLAAIDAAAVTIDGAPIVVALTDIEASNGVIHVVGGVLIP
jgi:uncharacterized surface protein with fasciclin (FAS1) repeats